MSKNSSRGQWIAVGIIMTLLVGALGVGMLLNEDIAQVTTGVEAPHFSARPARMPFSRTAAR